MKKISSRPNSFVVAGILTIMSASMLLTSCGASANSSTPAFSIPASQSVTTTKTSTTAAIASISVIPSLQNVKVGDNFDVAIQITTDTPTRGIGMILNWDPSKAQCVSADQGTFYTAFAESNDITSICQPDPLTFDNKIGKFPAGMDSVPTDNPNGTKSTIYAAAVVLVGGAASADNRYPAPKGTGNVFILHMTAIAAGSVDFTLSNVGLPDNHYAGVGLNPTINNGTITIK